MKIKVQSLAASLVIILIFNSCSKEFSIRPLLNESGYNGRAYYNPPGYDSTYSYSRYFLVENYKNNEECHKLILNYAQKVQLDTVCKVNSLIFLESTNKLDKMLATNDYDSMGESTIVKFERVSIQYFSNTSDMKIAYKKNLKVLRTEIVKVK